MVLKEAAQMQGHLMTCIPQYRHGQCEHMVGLFTKQAPHWHQDKLKFPNGVKGDLNGMNSISLASP